MSKVNPIPRHIAIIMDGNGRWASSRFMPRIFGHKKGVEALRKTISGCLDQGVEFLTVFAFSSENWRRKPEEVSFLMNLFSDTLEREISSLHEQQIRLKIVGNTTGFSSELKTKIQAAEELTKNNKILTLTVAVDYGGRWDILQAMEKMLKNNPDSTEHFTELDLQPFLSTAYAPEPELLVRTSGEQRISNFMLWQLAYAELFFTPTLWPDFDQDSLKEAITWYQQRERRFGG